MARGATAEYERNNRGLFFLYASAGPVRRVSFVPGRRLLPAFLRSAAGGFRLRRGQSRLDANWRDVQLATGPPPFVGHHRHRQQIAAPVRRHHGRYAKNKTPARPFSITDRRRRQKPLAPAVHDRKYAGVICPGI